MVEMRNAMSNDQMNSDQKRRSAERQQSADIPCPSFGKIRIPAVVAATSVKRKEKAPAPANKDLPPILRKDHFFD